MIDVLPLPVSVDNFIRVCVVSKTHGVAVPVAHVYRADHVLLETSVRKPKHIISFAQVEIASVIKVIERGPIAVVRSSIRLKVSG